MEETKGKTTGHENLRPCKPGETHNPNGRPKGQRNYATIYREALRKIGETKDMTPEEVEDLLARSGLHKALKGDYKFYEDTMNRIHGKPKAAEGDLGSEENPINHNVRYILVHPNEQSKQP